MQTSANRSRIRLALWALLATFACIVVLATPAAAQDDSAAAQEFTPYNTATTGCGDATNIGSGNVAPIYVDGLPCVPADFPDWDQPYTNIKFCAPGSTTNCQIIDHIIVDSGSDGLRLVSTAIKSALLSKMPTVTGGGKPVTECEAYVDSYTYGPLKAADVYIAGKMVKSFPIQVIGAPGYPVPTDCANQAGQGSTETDTVASFDGNGLVGVAFTLTDTGIYYKCATNGKSCAEDAAYPGIPNLTSKFAKDNNGVVITLPAISLNGSSAPVMGSLIFGVGTETNNKPPAGTIPLFNNLSEGTFKIEVGTKKAAAYIDSGTNDLVVDGPWTQCADNDPNGSLYYCPSKNTAISLQLYSINKTAPQFHIGFTIGNSDTLQNNGDVAYSDIAEAASSGASLAGTFAMGLTTFFGHTNYFVFNGKSSSLGTGPINAISPQK